MFVGSRDAVQRRAGKAVSVQRVLRFEARASGELRVGEKQTGTFVILVMYEGKKIELEVPFRGRRTPPLSVRPSRLVVFAGSEEKGRSILATVLRAEDTVEVRDIDASCNHPQVSAVFTGSSNNDGVTASSLGRIDVTVNSDGAASFEAEVVLEAEVDNQRIRIAVPLRVRIVP
jgi:hypothetical protein